MLAKCLRLSFFLHFSLSRKGPPPTPSEGGQRSVVYILRMLNLRSSHYTRSSFLPVLASVIRRFDCLFNSKLIQPWRSVSILLKVRFSLKQTSKVAAAIKAVVGFISTMGIKNILRILNKRSLQNVKSSVPIHKTQHSGVLFNLYLVEGGALLISITIAFLIALFSSFLIILSLHFRLQTHTDRVQEKLESNLNSGFEMISSGYVTASGSLDLYSEGSDSVSFFIQPWGMLDVATVVASTARQSIYKSALLGQAMKDPDLVLQIPNSIDLLKVSGKTRIHGTCIVPGAKIIPGYVYGKGPSWQDYQTGKLAKAEVSSMPFCVLNERMLPYFTGQLKAFNIRSEKKDSVNIDFKDTLHVIYFSGTGFLNSGIFRNKVFIRAERELTIGAEANLKNVILSAPVIRFLKGTRVSVQAFATDSIVVEEGVQVLYPSVLAIGKLKAEQHQPLLKIHKDARVEGLVCTWRKEGIADLVKPQIILKEGSFVIGLVAGEQVECSGKLEGTVLAGEIVGKAYHTLVDAEMKAIGKPFVTPIWDEPKKRTVCAWISGH